MWIPLVAVAAAALAQDPVFSGPQPGEKVLPFKAYAVSGSGAGKEIQVLADAPEAPTALVFVHGIERSILPLLRVVDAYGVSRKDRIRTTFVFLTEDRLALENRLPVIVNSTQLKGTVVMSLDGIEGPGAYGLNKKCLVTIVGANKGKATANFALVQPGIADAPRVIAALAKTCGDDNPPSVEELQAASGQDRGAMAGPRATQTRQLDLTKLDTSTPEAMKRTIALLVAEVERLRAAQGGAAQPTRPAAGAPLPGAAPTDSELVALLRAFIKTANTDSDVDRALKAMEDRFKGDAGLRKQAVDGLIRVIHLKYGTEYAQKAGQAFVERHRG